MRRMAWAALLLPALMASAVAQEPRSEPRSETRNAEIRSATAMLHLGCSRTASGVACRYGGGSVLNGYFVMDVVSCALVLVRKQTSTDVC